jgi:hypothetical protein
MRPFSEESSREIAVTHFELTPPPAFDVAPSISVVEDEIVVLGPGSVAFSMTRAAAEETHRRLGDVLKEPPGPRPDSPGSARTG